MSVTLSRPETEERPDLIEPGTYEARFLKIVEVENKAQPNPQFPDAKWWPTKWEWTFEITEENGADGNWEGRLFKGKTNPTVANEKAKAFGWLNAIIKRGLFKGEDLDDTAFSGFPCAIEIGLYKDKDDAEWNYIVGVSRSRRGKMLPLPDWVKDATEESKATQAKDKKQPVAAGDIDPDDAPF